MNNYNFFNEFNSSNKEELVFTGDLKIQNTTSILNEMQINFNRGIFIIRIREILSLDQTFIQLLYAYIKSASQQKMNVRIIWEISSEYESMIKNCGFEELLNQN